MSSESRASSNGSFGTYGPDKVRFKAETASPRTTTPVRTVNSPRGLSPSASFDPRIASQRSLHDSVSSRPETPNSTTSGRSHTLVDGRLLLNDLDEGDAKEHVHFVHFEEDRALLYKYYDLPLELFGQTIGPESPKKSPRDASPISSPRNISPKSPREASSRSPKGASPKRSPKASPKEKQTKKRPKHPPRKNRLKRFENEQVEHSGFDSCLQVCGQPVRVPVEPSEEPIESLDFDSVRTDEDGQKDRTGTWSSGLNADAELDAEEVSKPHPHTRTTPSLIPEGDRSLPFRSDSTWRPGKATLNEPLKEKKPLRTSSRSPMGRDWKDVPVDIRGILRRVPSYPKAARSKDTAKSTTESTSETAEAGSMELTEAEKVSVEVQCEQDIVEDDADESVWCTGRRFLVGFYS